MSGTSEWVDAVYTVVENSRFAELDNFTREKYEHNDKMKTVCYSADSINTPRITNRLPDHIQKQTEVFVDPESGKVTLRKIRNGEFLNYIATPNILERCIEEDLYSRVDYPFEWGWFKNKHIFIDRPETPKPTELFPGFATPYWRVKDVYELETGEFRHIGGQLKNEKYDRPKASKAATMRAKLILFDVSFDCPHCGENEVTFHPTETSWEIACENCSYTVDSERSFEQVLSAIDGTKSRDAIVTQIYQLLFDSSLE